MNNHVKRAAEFLHKSYEMTLEYFKDTQSYLNPCPPYNVISREIRDQLGEVSEAELAAIISKRYNKYKFVPDKRANFLKEKISDEIYPTPTNKIIRKILDSNPELDTPDKILYHLIKSFYGFVHISQKKFYQNVQDLIYPHVYIKEISKTKQRFSGLDSPEQLANKISEIYSKYYLKSFLLEIQSNLYPVINFDEIITYIESHPGNGSSEDYIEAILEDDSLEYVSTEYKPLYEEVKENIYPDVTVTRITRARNECEGEESVSKLTDRITEEDLGYIRIEEKKIFEKTQEYIYPSLKIKIFDEFRRIYNDNIQPDQLSKIICDAEREYVEKTLLSDIKDRLYPQMSGKLIYKAVKARNDLKSAREIAKFLSQIRFDCILVEDKPLYEDVKSLLYPEVSIKVFTKAQVNNLELDVALPLAEKIAKDFKKYFLYHLLDKTQHFLVPAPPIDEIYQFAVKHSVVNEPRKLAYLIGKKKKSITYFSNRELDFCKQTQGRIYPEIKLTFILQLLKSNEVKTPRELTNLIINQYPDNYILADQLDICKDAQALVYPSPKLTDIFQLEDNLEDFTPDELAGKMIERNPDSYLPQKVKDFCEEVQNNIYPKPELPFVFQEMDQSKEVSVQELVDKIVDQYGKFIPAEEESFCKETRDLIFPQPKLNNLYMLKDKSDVQTPKELAQIFISEREKYDFLKVVKLYQRIQYLIDPAPGMDLVRKYVEKYHYLTNADEVTQKIVDQNPQYSLLKEKYQKKGWYG